MKVIHAILVLSLVLILACACLAQASTASSSSSNQQSIQTQSQSKAAQPAAKISHATVRTGPALQAGQPRSADVYVDGKFAMRIAASAGGKSPAQRARIIADRLNAAFASGSSWKETKVASINGNYTVNLGNTVIATADSQSACMMGLSTAKLASKWARQTVVAMGGKPRMIASNFSAVRAKVAGSQQQIGMSSAWSTASTKSVPLISASDNSNLGMATIAGSSKNLNMANAVMVYKSTQNDATVWTFVPTAQATSQGSLTRVPGVGLIGLSSSVIPNTGYMTGSGVSQSIGQMSSQWNSSINSYMGQQKLMAQGATKVVPIYSVDNQMVIGAAQVIGSRSSVNQASQIYASTSGDMTNFVTSATTPTTAATCPPEGLKDVMISSIIMLPQAAAAPAPAAPSTVAPSTTTPGTTEQSTPAPSTEQPSTSAPSIQTPSGTPSTPATPTTPATPNEGGPGSGY